MTLSYGTPTFSNTLPKDADGWTESTDNWGGDGAIIYSFNTVDKVAGNGSIQIRSDKTRVGTYTFPSAIDVSPFTTFNFWGKTISKNATINYIRFWTTDVGYYEIAPSLSHPSSWGLFSWNLSDFTANGTPDWANITRMDFEMTYVAPAGIVLWDKMYFGVGLGVVNYESPAYGTPSYPPMGGGGGADI